MRCLEPEQASPKVLYIEPDEILRETKVKNFSQIFSELNFYTSRGACSVLTDIKNVNPDIVILSTNVIEPYLFLVLEYIAMEKSVPVIVVQQNSVYGREIIQSTYGKVLYLIFVPLSDNAIIIRSIHEALAVVMRSRIITEISERGVAATLTLASILR